VGRLLSECSTLVHFYNQLIVPRDAYRLLAQAAPQLVTLSSNPLDMKLPVNNTETLKLGSFPPPSQPLLTYAQQDFPKVCYWRRSEWKKQNKTAKAETPMNEKAPERGGTRAAGGENVAMLFIEDANGVAVDGFRASEIRSHARSLFVEIASKTERPETWGTASVVIQRYFNHEMATRFPEFRYCELDWKVHKVATDAYPHWNPPAKKVKQEISDTTTLSQASKKRPLASSTSSTKSKKAKLAPSPSTPVTTATVPALAVLHQSSPSLETLVPSSPPSTTALISCASAMSTAVPSVVSSSALSSTALNPPLVTSTPSPPSLNQDVAADVILDPDNNVCKDDSPPMPDSLPVDNSPSSVELPHTHNSRTQVAAGSDLADGVDEANGIQDGIGITQRKASHRFPAA
jgi:hypothetical protein